MPLDWYLKREFGGLLSRGADIKISESRTPPRSLRPRTFSKASAKMHGILRKKKLFLFTAERIELSLNRIAPLYIDACYRLSTVHSLHQLPHARRRVFVALPQLHQAH
jgi:hypothetical protein